MDEINDLNFLNKLGDKKNLFRKIHKLILSTSENISFRIFPIYVSYFTKNKNIAIVFFKGKFTNDGKDLNLGVNLENGVQARGFNDARFMKYPGINNSISLGDIKGLTPDIIKVIKSIK